MPYVSLKRRIYDKTHAREYIPELEAWDPITKGKFGKLRELLAIADKGETLADYFELQGIRLFNKEVSRDMQLLKQYCRKKDWDEREEQKKLGEGQDLALLPTKRVVALLIDRIDELSVKIEEILRCLKSKKS